MNLFIESLVGGLLAGLMYSLVAIGFVLIYKASGVFNFAQGSMVLFAALTFVTLRDKGVDFWLAALVTLGIMVAWPSPWSGSSCARSVNRRSRCSWRRSGSASSSKAPRRC